MERFKNYLRAQGARTMLYTKALGKWLVVSGIAGVLCGLLGSAFHLGVDLANTLRLAHPWLIWLLPAAGLAITGIYAFFSVEGQSTNSIISEDLPVHPADPSGRRLGRARRRRAADGRHHRL